MTGLVGSSVIFTWSFSGGVRFVLRGVKKNDENTFVSNGILVSLDKSGNQFPLPSIPAGYLGCLSGSHSGSQAIFTLNSIKISDDRFYGCRIVLVSDAYNAKFDSICGLGCTRWVVIYGHAHTVQFVLS